MILRLLLRTPGAYGTVILHWSVCSDALSTPKRHFTPSLPHCRQRPHTPYIYVAQTLHTPFNSFKLLLCLIAVPLLSATSTVTRSVQHNQRPLRFIVSIVQSTQLRWEHNHNPSICGTCPYITVSHLFDYSNSSSPSLVTIKTGWRAQRDGSFTQAFPPNAGQTGARSRCHHCRWSGHVRCLCHRRRYLYW